MPQLPHSYWLTRRACLAGGGAVAGTAMVGAPPQDQPSVATDPPAVDLSTNLFTRLAARVDLMPERRSLFVLDTGAQATSVSDRLAREMGLRDGPDLIVHAVTASTLTPTVILPRLKLQEEVFENVVAPVFPFEQLGAEGLLGLNHLEAFSLLLDIRAQRAVLNPTRSNGVSFQFGGGIQPTRIHRRMSSVPTRQEGGLLLMEIRVGSIPAVAFLDTGSQYSVGNLALLRGLGIPNSALTEVTIHGVSGPPMHVQSGPEPGVQLGSKQISRMPLSFGDLHIFGVLGLNARPAMMIGADLLCRFERVGIDYRTSRITLGEIMRGRPR